MPPAAPIAQIPAVVVGGTDNCGGLGVVRSLGRAGVPVIAVDCEVTAPALHSRYARKVVMPELSGYSLVQNLVALQARLNSRPVLFLTSDEAVLTVSEHRAELQGSYRFRLPDHECLAALMKKNDFQRIALEAMPRERTISLRFFFFRHHEHLPHECAGHPHRPGRCSTKPSQNKRAGFQY